MVRYLGVAVLALCAADAGAATEPKSGPDHAACVAPAAAVAVPADLAGWSAAHARLGAAAKPAGAGKALLTQGVATDATLLPTGRVAYAVEPGKPGGSVSYGGLFAFDVARPGRYRVVQSGRSWVDVVASGKALVSVAHGHGPDCSGIGKVVEDDLAAKRYLLQIAANGEPMLTVMVAPVR